MLINETSSVSEALFAHFDGHKMNIAALGNLVPQFHMHVVVRYEHDAAWPKPIWGNFLPEPLKDTELDSKLKELRALFGDKLEDFESC